MAKIKNIHTLAHSAFPPPKICVAKKRPQPHVVKKKKKVVCYPVNSTRATAAFDVGLFTYRCASRLTNPSPQHALHLKSWMSIHRENSQLTVLSTVLLTTLLHCFTKKDKTKNSDVALATVSYSELKKKKKKVSRQALRRMGKDKA